MISLEEIVMTMHLLNSIPLQYREQIIEQSLSSDKLAVIEREITSSSRGFRIPKYFLRKALKGKNKEADVEGNMLQNAKILSHTHFPEIISAEHICVSCNGFKKAVLGLSPVEVPSEKSIRQIFGTYIEQLDSANCYYINHVREKSTFELYYDLSTTREKLRESKEDVRWMWGLLRNGTAVAYNMINLLTSEDIPDCFFCATGLPVAKDAKLHENMRKDWEYVKSLIESEKGLSQELETVRKMYNNEVKNNSTLEKNLKALETAYERKQREFDRLKKEFEIKPATSAKEWEMQLESDVTRLQERITYLQEKNESLAKEKIDIEKKLSALTSQMQRQKGPDSYERSQQTKLGEQNKEQQEILSLYKGKKVIVFGGHKNQFRNIIDILEPVGAKVEHLSIEHDGEWKRPPQTADLVIVYADHAVHKMELTLKRRASHLQDRTVRFSGSKATLPEFLAEQAEKYFPKPQYL